MFIAPGCLVLHSSHICLHYPCLFFYVYFFLFKMVYNTCLRIGFFLSCMGCCLCPLVGFGIACRFRLHCCLKCYLVVICCFAKCYLLSKDLFCHSVDMLFRSFLVAACPARFVTCPMAWSVCTARSPALYLPVIRCHCGCSHYLLRTQWLLSSGIALCVQSIQCLVCHTHR